MVVGVVASWGDAAPFASPLKTCRNEVRSLDSVLEVDVDVAADADVELALELEEVLEVEVAGGVWGAVGR